MRHVLRSTVGWAVVGGLGAVVALLAGVDRADLVGDGYLVFAAFFAALAAARIAAVALPRPRRVVPRALAQPPRRPARPESLRRMEDVVALAQADRFDLHFRLCPILQEVAAAALPGYAVYGERSLTPATWSLVQPDRPRPQGERGRGIATDSLAAVVAELERMLER